MGTLILGKIETFPFPFLKLWSVFNFFLKSQLGTRNNKRELENPVLVIKNKKIICVCCGGAHSVILLKDGQLLGFGDLEGLGNRILSIRLSTIQPILLMKDKTIKRISCGEYFTLVQTMNGEVFHFKGKKEQASDVNKTLVMKDTSIKFIQQRNFIDEWTPQNHQNCSKQFKEIVVNLLLCLKIQGIKVPKFVLFVIVTQIYQSH